MAFLDFEHQFPITSAQLPFITEKSSDRTLSFASISLLIPFANLNYPAITFDLTTSRWRLINHDARTIENEVEKAADSHIAGSYAQEARMIHPIATCDIVCDAFLD